MQRKHSQPLSHLRTRTRSSKRTVPRSRYRPCLEPLEERALMTVNVFLDYGVAFSAGTDPESGAAARVMDVSDLSDVNGPTDRVMDEAISLQDALMKHDVDYNGDGFTDGWDAHDL